MEVINKVAPTKKKSLLTSLINRNKRFRKLKNSRFYVDKEIYKRARCSVQKKLCHCKKKIFFESKLKDCISKPYRELLNHSNCLINLVDV